MKGKRRGDHERVAVLAALMTGQGVSEVARDHHLPRTTVRHWRASLDERELAEVGHKKECAFEQLLFDYLRELLRTLTAQVIFFRDPEWLWKQRAREQAILFGVMSDKMFRLLEATEWGRDDVEAGNTEVRREMRAGDSR